MSDDVQLTPAQTEKLLQFQDVSGIEDTARCREILQLHNWDIELAVQDTLNMREGNPSIFTSPPSFHSSPLVVQAANQRIFSSIRRWQPHSILGWGFFFVTYPINLMVSMFMNIVRFTLNLIRPDPRRYVNDPVGDVMTFIRLYESTYGLNHPVFYQGTYAQVLNDAKQELRFVLVYLHSENHQDTPEFCRVTLSNIDVINFINNNMLFWGCSVNLPEGYRVSQALRENTYPFLAVIVLRDNRMTLVARIEGPQEPQDLIRKIQSVISDNESALISARLERQERSLNQTLRQQQDEAYLESLRADQEKERKKREQKEREEEELRREQERVLSEKRRKEEIQRKKQEIAKLVAPEPSPGEPNVIQTVIKLPSGNRLERRFKATDSLKHLYYFVFCHDEAPDDFNIVTNFPKSVLPAEPTPDNPDPPSFHDLGFERNQLFFVQDLDA